MLIVLGAALGAIVASFVNVVAERSLEGRPWWGAERSVCSSCGRVLEARELIPVFSFLLQRGRCAGCGVFFGYKYIIVEIIGASMGGLAAVRWGFSLAFFSAFVASFFLLLNALTDFYEGYIFDLFSLGMLVPALLFRLDGGFPSVWEGILGAALGLGILAAIILVTRGGMGWGDAFLMCGLGGFLGWKLTLLAFYIGVMSAGLGAVWLLLTGKVKWGKGQSMALGPFLSFGGFITILYGRDILNFISLRFNFF